jgi:hypothetical protein
MTTIGVANTHLAPELHEAHAVIASLTDLEVQAPLSEGTFKITVQLKSS